MHLYYQQAIKKQSTHSITAASWMGRVPDECATQAEVVEQPLVNHVTVSSQEGWLALGNVTGITGPLHTTTDARLKDGPGLLSINVEGAQDRHRSPVLLARFNEPYQLLATCHANSFLIFWKKFQAGLTFIMGVSLVENEQVSVQDLSYSHGGDAFVISYSNSSIVLGRITGPLQMNFDHIDIQDNDITVTCCTWTPADDQFYLGTSTGAVIIFDRLGNFLSGVIVNHEIMITALQWSCPQFNIRSKDDEVDQDELKEYCVLFASFLGGTVILVKKNRSHERNIIPISLQRRIYTRLRELHCDWSNAGEILAVGGQSPYSNSVILKFYSKEGLPLYTIKPPQLEPHLSIKGILWALDDHRIFLSQGHYMQIMCVAKNSANVPTLEILCSLAVKHYFPDLLQIRAHGLPSTVTRPLSMFYNKTLTNLPPEVSHVVNQYHKPHRKSSGRNFLQSRTERRAVRI